MEDLEKVKVADKDLTLKTKYRLPSSESPTPNRHRMEASQVLLSFIYCLFKWLKLKKKTALIGS